MECQERNQLIWIHAGLFMLQIAVVGLAVGVDSAFSGLAVPVGAAQSFFPNPFKKEP